MIEQVLGDPEMLRRMFATKAVETKDRVPGYDLRHVSRHPPSSCERQLMPLLSCLQRGIGLLGI